MRDTQYPLRRAVDAVLKGNVTFNGAEVKFYDEKKKVGATDKVYGLYSTQQSNKSADVIDCTWITDETIDIELHHRTEYEVTKDHLDDASNQVYQLLLPSRLNAALENPHLMQIQFFDFDRAITRTVEITPTETVITKIITFSAKIV